MAIVTSVSSQNHFNTLSNFCYPSEGFKVLHEGEQVSWFIAEVLALELVSSAASRLR